jgi:hypothetical protein
MIKCYIFRKLCHLLMIICPQKKVQGFLKVVLRLLINPIQILSYPTHSMAYFGHMWPWF